jgi:hypothetical protein
MEKQFKGISADSYARLLTKKRAGTTGPYLTLTGENNQQKNYTCKIPV